MKTILAFLVIFFGFHSAYAGGIVCESAFSDSDEEHPYDKVLWVYAKDGPYIQDGFYLEENDSIPGVGLRLRHSYFLSDERTEVLRWKDRGDSWEAIRKITYIDGDEKVVLNLSNETLKKYVGKKKVVDEPYDCEVWTAELR